MEVPLSFENNLPIYLQLSEQIKVAIISGELAPGDRLLSVREWATLEKVNPNTMQKALSELERLGLIFTERTSGRFVTRDDELIAKYKEEHAELLAEEYLVKMGKIGFSKDAAKTYLEYVKGEKK